MTLDAIKTELHKQPFRPFALVMADGNQVVVPHHDYLTFSPSGRSLNVYHSPDGYRIVSTEMVTQVVPNVRVKPAGRRRPRGAA